MPRKAQPARRTWTAEACDGVDWIEFRWLIEEYRVSLFAKQLGTSVKVSDKVMREALTEITGAK